MGKLQRPPKKSCALEAPVHARLSLQAGTLAVETPAGPKDLAPEARVCVGRGQDAHSARVLPWIGGSLEEDTV